MLLTWLVCSQLAQLLQFMWSLHCHNGFGKGTTWGCWTCATGGDRFPWDVQECSLAGQFVGQRFISLRYRTWSRFEFVRIALNLCVKEEKLKVLMQGMAASHQAADCSPAGAGLSAAPPALTQSLRRPCLVVSRAVTTVKCFDQDG